MSAEFEEPTVEMTDPDTGEQKIRTVTTPNGIAANRMNGMRRPSL